MTEIGTTTPRTSGSPPRHRRSGSLAGATVGMAIGTALSRLTGLIKLIVLAIALPPGGVTGGFSDAYNLANTTPNIITDLLLGGVLSATFVPVFVDRLTTRRPKEAWRAISAVTTITIVVLVAGTIVFWFAAPAIIDVYTVANHASDVHRQQDIAITLLRWFVPQLTCYGIIALLTALLNARRKFAAPMFVPIANNLVVIIILLWYHHLVPNPSLSAIAAQHEHLVLLGFGTTLGVIVQAVLLLPSLRGAGLHLRFVWEPAHEAIRTIVRLGSWTFGLVVSNQVALVVILALADGVHTPGAVSAYSYAYTFFQLPYGVVAVSIMSAVTPSLAERWTLRDTVGFRQRMAFGLRGMLAIIIPSAVGMVILSHPMVDLVLHHARAGGTDAGTMGSTLAMFSLGLPGFCLFLYAARVFQAMQDTRTAFFLYVLENGINIVLGLALVGPLDVRGLALSLSVAYSISAVVALLLIRGRVGGLGGDDVRKPLVRVVLATAVMAVATVLALNVSSSESDAGLLGRLVLAVVVGSAVYVGATMVLGSRSARQRARARRGRAEGLPPGRVATRGTPVRRASGPAAERAGRARSSPGAPARAGDPAGDSSPADAGGPGRDDRRSLVPGRGHVGSPFHARIDAHPADRPFRHLRPVRDVPGDEEEGPHGQGSGGD